jgi:hypothetical protein
MIKIARFKLCWKVFQRCTGGDTDGAMVLLVDPGKKYTNKTAAATRIKTEKYHHRSRLKSEITAQKMNPT